MAIVRLDRVVTSEFINRFRGAASSAGATSSPFNSQASSTSISDGLRIGAQTFANAVQNINTTISVVNVARSTLEDLGEIADDMILLAERASQRGVGDDSRRKFNSQFQKLVEDFRETISGAELGDLEYLTKEGLSELFTRVGLERTTSDSIAKIFSKFITPDDSSSLASERSKAERPLALSSDTFRGPASSVPYRVERRTSTNLTAADFAVSAENTIILGQDTVLGQNPGKSSLFTQDQNGTLAAQQSGLLTEDGVKQLFDVSEVNGYSLVLSNEDPLGFNAANDDQLFILDEKGRFIQQVTTISGAAFSSASLSGDGKTVVYATSSTLAGTETLNLITQELSTFGVDPGTLVAEMTFSASDLEANIDPLTNVKVNNEGTKVLFYDPKGGYRYFDLTDSSEIIPVVNGSTVERAEFVGEDTVVLATDYNGGGLDIVVERLGDGTVSMIAENIVPIGTLAVAQSNEYSNGKAGLALTLRNDNGLYAYSIDVATLTATTVDLAPGPTARLDLGTPAQVLNLSAAFDKSGELIVGLTAELPAFGSSQFEGYRLSANPRYNSPRYVGFAAADPEKLLDGTIARRPDALRTLADLKELKGQIKENIKALDDSVEVLESNITLARESGLAFLEISEQISSSDKAEDVARKVRDLIRRNASEALAQTENLESVAVAALLTSQ